jgi:site-specific DNA-cytosine methylase
MAERPLYTLYKNLKAQNYDVPDDYNKFESALTRDGKGGADNRHAIYENLKAQNFDVPSTYERFYSALFEPRSKTSSRAKGGSVPMSAADRARFSAGAAAISASAQQTMNNAGRYNRLKQRKQKQQKGFGRVNLGTNKTPYGGDANNVVKDDFAYNPETGKTGAYVTSDNENVYSLPEAEQMQAILDKQNDAYQVAVDTGEIPSAFDVRDKNGNYDLQENIGKNGIYLTEEGAQKQFDKKLADAYARKKEIEALIAEDNRQHGNPLLSYGASIGASNGRTAEQSDYRNKLATSLSLVTEQIGALEAVKQYPTSSWGEDALKALDNTAFTAKTWDFGLTDFAIMGQMERIKTKMDNNIPLSGSDKMLLKSKLGADAATALEDEKMGNVYRWTKIAGQSLPFMADFFLTGGYGGITKGISRGALKFAAKRGMGKVSAAILKNTGIVAGDVIGSYAMAGTEQALKTGADIMQRHLGNLYQDEKGDYKFGTFDENGNLLHEGGESIGTALYKGLTSAMVENYTERLFGHNYGVKKGAIAAMEKHGMNGTAQFFKNIGKSGWYTNSKKWMEKFGINGFGEEVMEEEIGIPLHALLDGDNKFSDLGDVKQQLDIIGGMAISVGSMYAMGAGSRPVKGIYNRAQYYRFRNKVNVADSDAQNLMGDNWADIKDKIDNATNEQMGSVLADILRQRDTMTKEQINAAVNYGVNLMKMRGYNIAKTAEMNAKEITNELTTPEEQHQADIDNAYSEGHDADDADKHDIQILQEDQMKTLAAALGISEQQLSAMSDEELESLTGQDDKLDQAIYDYQLSSARYQGVVDDAQDKVDLAAHQAEQRVDMYTDQSRGSVRNATIKASGGLEDYGVYIISSNIATHDDGSIDVSNSDDMILYYDPTTNSVEHADALMFAELGEELPADDVKAQAVSDSKENAIKEVAGIIDGTVEVGSQFNVTDTDGTEHTYEVLADYGDGTAAISIDGNVVENPYSLADLQQMKDLEDQKRLEAAKAEREQMEKERAAQQNQETEETQPSFDFNQILNDDGNVVLVDVLGKDGNTKYPDSKLFLIRDTGAKAKVVELKSDGTIVPHAVNKEDVATISSMSLDEYKQAMAESSMIEDNSGENRGEIEVETPTIEGETAAPAEETPATEQTPVAPAITLEDGTIVPMLEDGNPDFSKLTAAQTAELYDTQFGEDADSIVSGYVSDAKKALDKASNMTVKGKTFVEQKAAKDDKEKAIADAQAAYDSAIAIRDAYNERQLAKVEDTAEGRKELIEKARRKFARLKSAVKNDAEAVSQLYRETIGSLLHRLYDSTGIDVTDTTPPTAEEYVASNLGAHSLNYEGTETSKGVKQETGLSREDFAKTQLLAADGKGTTIDALVHSLWENRPSNLESLDTQDIRNVLIGVLNSGFKASEARNFVENIRIAQAENILEEQKRAQENAAYAEQHKAEPEAELKAKSDEKAELKAKSEAKLDNESDNKSNDLSNESDNEKINDNINDNINVPEDATDENPLVAQRDESDLPFSAKENGKQQTTAERAADVEKNKVDDMKVVDNIVGEKTRKAFERLAKMMGANIQWQYSDKLGNGWIQETTDADGNVHRTIFITLDSSITEGAQFIFGHEMTHQIKNLNPAAYNELTQLVLDTYGSDAFDKAVDETMQRYSDAGFSGRARDYYAEEVVADSVGEMIRDLNLAHTLAMKMSHPLLAAIHEILQKIKLAFFGTEYNDVTKNIIRSIEQAYVKTANGQVTNSETGEDVSFSLRQKPEPKKKGVGYKVFVLKDGKLYPPMVANPDGAATPVGVWLDADAAPIAGESKTGRPQVKQGGKGTQGGSGKLAYRPGWHLGVVPYAIQFNRKDAEGNKTLFPKNFVFAEVEYAADVDYQEEARQEGINPSGKYQHSLAGLKHLPTDGYYMYRTNPNPETDPWVITGAMKVNRILTRVEQADLVSKAGREPQQIQEGDIVTDDVVNSINQEIADAPKFSLKVYHGSGADFTEFDFDHMGEGAGSETFGHGIYVTKSAKIGASYALKAKVKKIKTPKAFKAIKNGDNWFGRFIDNAVRSSFAKSKKETFNRMDELIKEDENIVNDETKPEWKKNAAQKELADFDKLKSLFEGLTEEDIPYLKRAKANRYEVEIPDDTGNNYLDWNKPMNKEQKKIVREGLEKLGVDVDRLVRNGYSLDKNFGDVYNGLLYYALNGTKFEERDSFVASSNFLSSLGFTGIKYYAGTIWGGAKKGDLNYVIFNEDDAKIVGNTKFSLKKVNDAFNQRLDELVKNPNQKDKILHLGRSSSFLKAGGITDAEIELDFDKFIRKSGDKYKNNHPFAASDLINLPMALAEPIAVFNSTTANDHVVLTELQKDGKNFIVAVRAVEQHRKGGVVLEVNKITSLYPKEERGIVYWINNGRISNVDKEKALHFIEALQPHAGTTITDEELKSAANIINSFETTKGNGEKVDVEAPKTFDEFLNHPSLKFSIKNEQQRKAAEDAYEYAFKLRPNKSSQYAIVDMSNPSNSPQYYEKKVLADRWRRFYNKAVHNELDDVYKDAWGNYKLFDLADQVNEVKGDVPSEFNAPDVVANKNADNESGAEYHEYKQDEPSSITYKDRYKAFKQREANREKTAGLRKERKEVEDVYKSKSEERVEYNKQLMKEYMDEHGLSSENDIPYDVWDNLRSKSFEKYQDELDSLFNKYKDLDKQIKAVAGPRFSLKDEKIKSVAEKFGVNEDDVAMYANAVEKGSTAEAARARANIKRYLLQANEDKISSFEELMKYTVPVNESLKENFGDLDAMIEEQRKQVEAERNAMEAARKRAQEEEEKRQKHLDELSLIPTDELDKRYMDAIANNDESTAREMLDESARRKGYGDVDSDYQGQGAWAAPSNPQYESDEARRADIENSPDVNLEDIALGYSLQPDDYFDNPRAYMNNTAYGLESAHVIKNALDAIKNGEKDVKVKVYRAVPTSVKEGKLRNGDWVTPSKKYAEMHGDNRLEGKYRIIEDEVPANQLWWDGNDANEFGFDDGKEYRYKNAKNNRKLNDLITYDNKGNVIPPSKRFNSRKNDIRFSLAGERGAADMAEDLKSLNTPDEVDDAIKTAIDDMPSGWKMANKKMIHIVQALGENRKAEIAGEEPKFSLKDGTLIKAGTYFSGGGLVEEGLKGIIDPVVAVEYDEKISGVYRNNFGQHIVTADVRDVDPRELVKQIDGEVEYFHASPVCKNYSQAKSNHAEVELDKETAASTAEFINAIKPKVVTIENVKGYKDSEAMKTITDALDANGYTWDADVYNAADYGGYTNRERLIVRAVRDGKLPAKPEKMARKSGWYEAVADIIPTLTEKKNGVAPWMDIRLKADGIDWRNIDKPLYVMGSAYADGKVPHAFADELLPTLRTKSGDVIVMPDGKVYRALGRVLARVSGVSDDYKMPFSENLSHTIIGNGIPTQLTEHVIAPLLQNTLRPTTPDDGNTRFSLRYDQFEHDLNQWKKDNNLPKDAQRPTIPQRNAGESAVDFLRRVDEYRKQMALWKTAPTYEQHLLSDDTALGEFNRELQCGSVLKRIAFQDSMLAIRKAQEAIMKEVGVDRLNMAEDAYTAENRSHGKGKNEFEEYNNEFLQPLRKAYHQMKKILGDSYDNVRIYMMAKHGLERDAQMAFKKSLEADYEDVAQRSAAYNAYKGDMNRIINDSDLEFGRVDFTTWRQRDNALRVKYSPSYMDYRYDKNGIAYDYSGLSALFDGSDFEEDAYKLVKDIEDKYVAETHNLWDATNAATKKILRDGYKAGMMSKDTYQYVRDMYSHYIPLRGWDGTTADQVWNYVGGGKGAFNQTLKTAHGRASIADDPIAYIENMAESGILLNNKNWVKQHLMLLAQNHPTSLLTLSKAWYVKSTDANGNEEWIPATPQITSLMNSNQVKAAIDAFEEKMEQMAQTGDATQQRDGLNIAYPQTHSEEREHEVRVMKDGEEYVIYVNGDPQLAQAMNNTRAHRVREIQSGKLDRAAAWLGRKMAVAYTSLSPLFVPSNYFRDLTMTLASTAIREDAKYNYLLRKNLATSWNLGFILRDYQNGKLREKVSNGNATKKEQMFYDFMMNGGETGFVSSLDVEDLKKKFKNDLKDLDRWKANPVKVGHTIMDSIEFLNRAIEDSNRFAVYMTSIQYGRSVDEAVNDAKDVTLNFNRKGTGEYSWQTIRNLYLFINPAVQSLQTLGALAKHHPFKSTAVTASWLASGVLVPIVNVALMQLGAAFLGGDGDDDKDWYKDISKKYWQFSKWDRRNNFIMWVPTTHEFVKIPLAQEFRAFYGLGDMIASKMMGGELAEESWEDYGWDLVGQVVDMLPLDPTGYDGNIAVSLMPNAIRPVFELAFNVDFTGKPLFKETEYNKYDPNFTKAYVGTPDWLVRASEMVNSIGNDYPDVQQNSIDAFGDPRYNLNNPAVADHVLSSYLGGAYTMGSQVLGLLTKSLNDPKEIKVADIPLFSKFVSNPDDRPVTKKQGDEFWDMKENHDRAANTLSKLKKQAKVDGDYSMLERFYGSEEYKQYKQDDVKVKKYEEDKKKERAEESGEEYRPHKLNAEDIYKAHATPNDDFEDLKLKQLYTKLNGFKSAYDLLVDTAPSQSDGYYNTNKAAIDAIDEISIDKQEISELKKGFLDDGKDAYNAEDMKQIRDLRKRILAVLEKANKAVVANQKAKAKK